MNFKQSPPKPYRLVARSLIVSLVLLSGIAEGQDLEPEGVRQTFDRLNQRLLATQANRQLDNTTGSIVWGSAYQLDSYISMFEATGDTIYLNDFLELGDRVLAARADRMGMLDFKGRLTFGWPSGNHYTYGKWTVLEDREGNPSLEIRTIANSYNNKTSIEVSEGANHASFDLKVLNRRNPERPTEIVYQGLTLETVEKEVNPSPGESRWIEVRKVGEEPPKSHEPFTPETELMTFHGHHTGRILTPFARFCDIVLNSGDELADYNPKAEEYLKEIRVTMAEHDQFFIEEEDWGYTIFETGSPFWCDGVPEPHNTMACSGSTYIHLYRATGEPYFLDRATRLAKLFHRNHIPRSDGAWMFHYWWGEMEKGWTEEAGISENLPSYGGQSVPEDVSHLQLTLMFVVDCYENGIVFEKEDVERWAETFNKVLYREDEQGPYLPFRVDGETSGKPRGSSNHVLYGWLEIGAIADPMMVEKCAKILETSYRETASETVMNSYAALAKAVSKSK